MLNRSISLAVCGCVVASLAAFGQSQGTEYLIQEITGTSSLPGEFAAYNALANPLVPVANTSGPTGLASIIPMPDGSKFYVIGSGSIQVFNSSFQLSHSVSLSGNGLDPQGLTPTITAATLTPNGQYLLVGTSDTGNNFWLWVVSTANDAAYTSSNLPIQLNGVVGFAQPASNPVCPECFIAVSRDSSSAYLIENSIIGGNTILADFSLSSFQKIGSLSIAGSGNALTLSPGNMLYFTGGNQIRAIDPVAFASIATIPLSGFNPGPLVFSPDGTVAYAVHQIPLQNGPASLLSFNPATNTVNWYSPSLSQQQAGPQLSQVFVASDSSIYALSSNSTTFYDVNPTTGLNVSTPSPTLTSAINGVAQENVIAAEISSELPQAAWLFVLIANGNQPFLDRINLSSDTVAVTNLSPAFSSGSSMAFFDVPSQGAAAGFLTFNANQTVSNGGTSIPLIARAYGSNGLPVYNTAGSFTAAQGSGVIVNSPNVVSNADGYVQTTVSVPTSGVTCPNGVCAITLSLGGSSATFNITVPGATGPGCTSNCGTGSSSSQVTITQGDGQMVPSGEPGTAPLTVLVTDATGTPQSGVVVNFTVTSGTGYVNSQGACSSPTTCTATTDTTGQAAVYYSAGPVQSGTGSETDTVVATATVGTSTFNVTFYETSFINLIEGSVTLAQPSIQISPGPGATIPVSAGSPATNAISAVITDVFGNPIQNVGVSIVQLESYPPTPSPYASCQGNPLSDQTGTVNCTVVTTCSTTPGNYGISIAVGDYVEQDDQIQVTAPNNGVTTMSVTSGNNQSGTGGTRAALPLLATVNTFCGAPAGGVQVTWKVTQGSATLQQTTNTSNTLGEVSNVLTFGTTAGMVTVTATAASGGTATFTLTNNIAISAITPVSGGGQTATTGQAFAQPLVVSVVDTNQHPVSGVQVTFSVTSGNATVNPATVNTGTNGQAQTTVTAGSSAGAVLVTASVTGFSTTFNLTVTPPGPSITPTSFVNAASNAPGLVACGLAIVTGNGLASTIAGVVSGSNGFGPLPYTLQGVSMTVNGTPAPIQAVSNQNGVQQVNFQTPCEVSGSSTATVVITINGIATTISGVQVLQAQPGIFTYAGPNNTPYAVVISAQNGEYVTPSNPAIRGQNYYVVVTGLGQTSPPMITNNVSVAGENVVPTMVVGVGNSGVPVLSAAAYVDTFGAYLVEFQLPTTATPGTNIPFAVAADVNATLVFGNSTFLAAVQ